MLIIQHIEEQPNKENINAFVVAIYWLPQAFVTSTNIWTTKFILKYIYDNERFIWN